MAGVKPNEFTLPTTQTPSDSNFEFYSQKDGVNTKLPPSAFLPIYAPKIITEPLDLIPTIAGNQNFLRNTFFKSSINGFSYFVDYKGDSFLVDKNLTTSGGGGGVVSPPTTNINSNGRYQTSNFDIKFQKISGNPQISVTKNQGRWGIVVTGGVIEINRVQVKLAQSDIDSNDTFTLIAPTTQSGTSMLQYPTVEKINAQLGGLPSNGLEHIADKDNNPQIQYTTGSYNTQIETKILNISNLNTNIVFVFIF